MENLMKTNMVKEIDLTSIIKENLAMKLLTDKVEKNTINFMHYKHHRNKRLQASIWSLMSVYKYDHQCILFSQKAIVKSTNLRKNNSMKYKK